MAIINNHETDDDMLHLRMRYHNPINNVQRLYYNERVILYYLIIDRIGLCSANLQCQTDDESVN